MGKNANRRRARRARAKVNKSDAPRTTSVSDRAPLETHVASPGVSAKEKSSLIWTQKTIFRNREELPVPEVHDFFGAILRASFSLVVDEDLNAAAEEVGRVMGADNVVMCWGENNNVVGRYRAAPRDSATPLEVLITDTAHRRVVSEGEALLIQDVPRDTTLNAPVGPLQQFGAILAAPLWDGPVRKGVLCASRREVCSFHEDDKKIFVELGEVLSRDWRRSRLLKEAFTCHVTGLLSRQGALFHVERDLERAARQGRVAAVAMIDVDGLAALNEKLGRPSVDNILREIGENISERSRASEWVAHLGGGTFCVVLTGKETVDVEGALSRLIDTPDFAGERVTLSAGAAICGPHESAADAMRATIQALLRAKSDNGGHLNIAYPGDLYVADHEN